MAPHRAAVVCAGLLCAALLRSAAFADDLAIQDPGPPLAPTYFTLFQEVRGGVYAHNWIHDENSPVDLSAEILSSPIGYASNFGGPWFSWFFNPRINVGAMVNTGGKTSYAFTGLTWRIPIYKAFFFEGEFGGAVNNAPTHPEEDRVDMGCRLTFREIGRLRIPVQRACRSDRQHRAHLARDLLHPYQPGPDPGRGEDRV